MKKIYIGLLVVLLSLLLLLKMCYAALVTTFTIDSNVTITGIWDLQVTDVKIVAISDGLEKEEAIIKDNNITFNPTLKEPGDYVTYEITIKNNGNIDAKLTNINLNKDNENGLILLETNPQEILKANETTTFTISIFYDQDATTLPEQKTIKLNGIVEYTQNNKKI